jgi:hypothetical protein
MPVFGSWVMSAAILKVHAHLLPSDVRRRSRSTNVSSTAVNSSKPCESRCVRQRMAAGRSAIRASSDRLLRRSAGESPRFRKVVSPSPKWIDGNQIYSDPNSFHTCSRVWVAPSRPRVRFRNAACCALLCALSARDAYFIAVTSSWRLATRLVPKDCKIAMIATAMQAAINPYSIAVAPVSSLTNLTNRSRMFNASLLLPVRENAPRLTLIPLTRIRRSLHREHGL